MRAHHRAYPSDPRPVRPRRASPAGGRQYGKLDKRYDRTYQALYSYKLTFRFTTDAGELAYLDGKTFQVEKVDFVEEYFPEGK